MLAFTYYLLKVIICSAVLYGYYWFFLRNKVFHHYNRFYLLAVLVLSLTLPLLKFNIWQKTETGKPGVIQMLQVVNSSDEYMDEVILYSRADHFPKEQLALWVFVTVSLVFAFFFIRTLLKISSLKRNNPAQQYDDINIINTNDKSTPFSFLKNIFWNDAINMNTDNGGRILKHELAHVEQKHSHDKLFVNIVLIFFWCNPIFWLLRKELNMIHEFTADKKAVEDGDTAAFAAMILQATYPRHQFELTNNFFYSPIKRRLAMLTKNTRKASYISRLLVLPLAAFVFAAFTFKTQKMVQPFLQKQLTVVIDAGHGGSDKGASIPGGQFEKDMNLELAQKIKELNTSPDINIVLTRETDIYQSPKEKAILAKKLNADLFISIHLNAVSGKDQTEYSGASVFVARDQFENVEKSKLLASALIGTFKGNYGLPVESLPKQAEVGIWVLQSLTVPSVLIESGFANNKKDVAYLRSAAGKENFAKNVLAAIYQFAQSPLTTQPASAAALHSPIGNNTGEQLKVKETSVENGNIVIADKNNTDASVRLTTADGKNISLEGNVTNIRIENGDPKSMAAANQFLVDASQGKKANTGSPAPDVTIRDFPKAEPLYVLDGNIIPKTGFAEINPESITSVNVLKNDNAFQKYGAAAKDGVIEIFTKPTGQSTTKQSRAQSTEHKGISTFKTQPDTLALTTGDKIFTKLEQEAEFPGGKDAWLKFLMKNLDADMPLTEHWGSGTYKVVVRFQVDQQGNVSEVVAENFRGTKTAEMCVNLIKNGPKWIPGKQNGKVVSSYKKQPVTFVIEEQ